MLSGKERAKLKSLAVKLDPVATIGHEGITENSLIAIDKALLARELIKVSMLGSCSLSARDVADKIEQKLKAETITVIGRKIVFYRVSKKPGVKHIEL